jgi:hypothetical protein
MKGLVPTHPHPAAPDQPPLEAIVGMIQAPIDKLYDRVMRSFPMAPVGIPQQQQ